MNLCESMNLLNVSEILQLCRKQRSKVAIDDLVKINQCLADISFYRSGSHVLSLGSGCHGTQQAGTIFSKTYRVVKGSVSDYSPLFIYKFHSKMDKVLSLVNFHNGLSSNDSLFIEKWPAEGGKEEGKRKTIEEQKDKHLTEKFRCLVVTFNWGRAPLRDLCFVFIHLIYKYLWVAIFFSGTCCVWSIVVCTITIVSGKVTDEQISDTFLSLLETVCVVLNVSSIRLFSFQGFITSPKDEIKQYAAELYAVIMVTTSSSQQLLGAIEDFKRGLSDKVRDCFLLV